MYYTERQIRACMLGVAVAALGVGAAGWLGAWWLLGAWLATLGGALAGLYGLVSTRAPAPPAPEQPGPHCAWWPNREHILSLRLKPETQAAMLKRVQEYSTPQPPARRFPDKIKPRFKIVDMHSLNQETQAALLRRIREYSMPQPPHDLR